MYDHHKACDEALTRIARQIAASAMRHCHEIHTAFHDSRVKLGLSNTEPKYHTGGVFCGPVTEYKVVCVGGGGGAGFGFGGGGGPEYFNESRRRPPMPPAPPKATQRAVYNYGVQAQNSGHTDDNFVSGVFVGHTLTGAADFSGGYSSDSGSSDSSCSSGD